MHPVFHLLSSVWINCPLSIVAVSLCALCGCVIYAFYHDCDPLTKEYISSADQVSNVLMVQVNHYSRTMDETTICS